MVFPVQFYRPYELFFLGVSNCLVLTTIVTVLLVVDGRMAFKEFLIFLGSSLVKFAASYAAFEFSVKLRAYASFPLHALLKLFHFHLHFFYSLSFSFWVRCSLATAYLKFLMS